MSPSPGRRPKLLYLVTEDWYFWSHRLPMARAARDAGFEVAVATRVQEHGERIAAEDIRVLPLDWERRSVNPIAAVRVIAEITDLYKRERPDILHHVALKPVVLGGIAAARAKAPAVVHALTGLGSALIGKGGAKGRLAGAVARPILRQVLGRANSRLVLQNADDRDHLVGLGLVDPRRVRLIRGSGIDVARFTVLPEPEGGPITVAYVGRLLEDKGLRALITGHARLRAEGHDIRLILAGTADPENPTSIPADDLARWTALPGVELSGHVGDVRQVWARAHIAVLPSRREGLPMSLMEAAACGRAIIATDVPGCREIAHAGVNALTVPVDDAQALAGAIARLAEDGALRQRFAKASREMVLSDLTAERVGAQTVELYQDLLNGVTERTG